MPTLDTSGNLPNKECFQYRNILTKSIIWIPFLSNAALRIWFVAKVESNCISTNGYQVRTTKWILSKQNNKKLKCFKSLSLSWNFLGVIDY